MIAPVVHVYATHITCTPIYVAVHNMQQVHIYYIFGHIRTYVHAPTQLTHTFRMHVLRRSHGDHHNRTPTDASISLYIHQQV